MKIIFIIISLWGIFPGELFHGSSSIDFNPNRLNKEIERQFKIANFQKDEIVLNDIIQSEEIISGKFYRLSVNDSVFGYAYLGRVNSCRKNGCSAPNINMIDETTEFFDYFILYTSSKMILNVVVYNYEATHGQEITAKGWLKQFIGYNGNSELVVGKNIDAISGATISVYGIVDDIQVKTSLTHRIVNIK